MNQRALSQITRIVVIQSSVIGVVTLLLGYLQQREVAYSIWVGGWVGIVPHLLVAIGLFCYQGSRYVKQIMAAFYAAEALKWGMAAGLFCAIFLWLTVTPWAVLIGFILAQAAFWVASMQHIRKLN